MGPHRKKGMLVPGGLLTAIRFPSSVCIHFSMCPCVCVRGCHPSHGDLSSGLSPKAGATQGRGQPGSRNYREGGVRVKKRKEQQLRAVWEGWGEKPTALWEVGACSAPPLVLALIVFKTTAYCDLGQGLPLSELVSSSEEKVGLGDLLGPSKFQLSFKKYLNTQTARDGDLQGLGGSPGQAEMRGRMGQQEKEGGRRKRVAELGEESPRDMLWVWQLETSS